MECPQCKKEMRLGEIVSKNGLYGLCWYPDAKPPYEGENSFVELPTLQEAYYCRDCRVIVVPAPQETEPLLSKWRRERRERRKESAKEEKCKKDPWEV